MADNKPGSQPAPSSTPRHYEFVLEMGDRLNRNFVWPLDKRQLRGRWSKANLPGVSMEERFAHMPDLPGVCLHVNTAKRTAIFFDPLNDEKNKRLLEKAGAVAEECFQTKHAGEDTVKLDLDENDVKSFCYWARRFLDARQCRIEQGVVPSMAEVEAMPGLISFSNHDTSATVEKLKDKPPRRYIPVRHEEELEPV